MKVQTVRSSHCLCTLVLIAAVVSNTAAVTDTINANRAFSASLIGISPSSTSLYYTPLTEDSGEDDENPFSEDFVSGLEQFFAGVENSKFIPWLILTSANVHLSMDDDPTKALSSISSSGSSSTGGSASFDRVHSLCAHDVQSLCSFSNLRSSMNSLSNTMSLGYSCKRIEICLWNAFEQRILSQPCGQAILDRTVTPSETPLMRSTDTPRTGSITATAEPFPLNVLQSILLWLQAHVLFQKILSMILSVLVIYLAFFPCHYHRHRFLAHHHSWRIQKQILQAIQQDSELFQHVQRVVSDGESIHRCDLNVSPCPTRNRRRHRFTLVYRVATCIVPKTTLMALILFLAWSSPLFMIVFLGFHVMIMAVLYLLAMLSEWITSSSSCDEEGSNVERGPEDETTDLTRPLLANSVHDESSGRSNAAAFVGVSLKIV